jgi:hypothetical protein
MTDSVDWLAWHADYQDESSPLSRRLRTVQGHIAGWLDERPDNTVTVLSACAGQGHDLIGVLDQRADADRVHATLIESDPRNVRAARAAATAARLANLEVRQADAGDLTSYHGAAPADLVLMAGVFGNISDLHVQRTITALPHLCRPGATLIWTRSRRTPDLTGTIRAWLTNVGFTEHAFDAPDDVLFSVGVHRLTRTPQPPAPTGRIFDFVV